MLLASTSMGVPIGGVKVAADAKSDKLSYYNHPSLRPKNEGGMKKRKG